MIEHQSSQEWHQLLVKTTQRCSSEPPVQKQAAALFGEKANTRETRCVVLAGAAFELINVTFKIAVTVDCCRQAGVLPRKTYYFTAIVAAHSKSSSKKKKLFGNNATSNIHRLNLYEMMSRAHEDNSLSHWWSIHK